MFFVSFFKYLYGRLRVILTFTLAIVLVLTLLVISRENVDADPGGAQSFRSASINQMNSQPDFNATLMQTISDSDPDYTPYSREMDTPDFGMLRSQQPILDAERSPEVSYVGFWLNPGRDDWMWGSGETDADVSIEINDVLMVTTHSDSIGDWGIDQPIEINPGDEVTVTAGLGLEPVLIQIPDPLVVQADSLTGLVWGQVGGRSGEWVTVHPHWGGEEKDTTTDTEGRFTVTYDEIPHGARGNLHYNFDQAYTHVDMNVAFQTFDLILKVHSDYDWIEGNYEPGHTVALTVYQEDHTTVKASTEVSTGPIDEWGGSSGFVTWHEGVNWIPEQPDIQPGDWIDGVVDVNGPYEAEVQIGWTTGIVDITSESVIGTLDAVWLLPGPVDIICAIWVENGPEAKYDSIKPDGIEEYSCSWAGEWDVAPGEHVQVSYFDPAQHEIMREFHAPGPEVSYVGFWLNPGRDDWMWGSGHTDADVSIEINDVLMVTTHSDSNGDWGIDQPIEINPGDEVTVTAGLGLEPVVIQVPDPLVVQADSLTGEVWGQVGGRSEEWVAVHPHWGGEEKETTTDTVGHFTVTYEEIPHGARGNLYYNFDQAYTHVDMNVAFQTFDLILKVHSDYDWIEGDYEPGHTVTLTVYEGDHTTIKATTEVSTGPIDEWGGSSGFVTWHEGVNWVPEQPDIQPGDWIDGVVDVNSPYEAEVQIGWTTGTVDITLDSVSGTLDAVWLLPGPVDIICGIWVENGPEAQYDSITPNGTDPYSCSWAGEWDVVPGEHVQVSYFDPAQHEIIREFHEPVPHLRIEKWFIGDGSPGVGSNVAFWVQYLNEGEVAAENVTITDTLDGMTYIRDSSGLTATVEPGDLEVSWVLGTIKPGDWIGFVVFAEVTAQVGEPVSNTVLIETSNPYDHGEPWEKTSTWEGTVASNDTHLRVEKWPWTWNPAPDEDFLYGVRVCNDGTTSSSDVSLIDTLPSNTSFVNWWSWDSGWYEDAVDNGLVEFGHTVISPNTCSEVFIRVHVKNTAIPGDEIYNTAVISGGNDLSTDDNEASVWHHVGDPYTDLSLGLGWHSGVLTPGGLYRYGIYFRNEGNTAVSSPIEITATLPEGTQLVYWEKWGWVSVGEEPVIDGQTVTWAISGLDPGYDGTIEVWLEIDPTTEPGSELVHQAGIEVQADEGNTDNNTSTLTEWVYDHGPNLRLRKDGGWHDEGHSAWFNIQVENIGDETVEPVVITDAYAEEMVLAGDVYSGYWEGWTWEDLPDEDYLVVNLDRLEPGWSVGINYDMSIPGEVTPGMVFENTASVPTGGDINPAYNSISFKLNYQSLQGESQLTSARTKCSVFAAGEASDVDRLIYKVGTDRKTGAKSIKAIVPSTFQYYVKVVLPAKASTIVVTQENIEGWPTMGASVALYDENYVKLLPQAATVTIADGNVTIDFVAGAAERVIYIAVNYTTKPIIGQVVVNPYPAVEYLFKAALRGEDPFTADSLVLEHTP
jgi:uncharacterized repeat protein (TIGR01451 family)